MYVMKDDVVAELGSQLRESSRALCERIGPNGTAVLVDIARKFPKERKQKETGRTRTSAMRRQGEETEFYTDRATFIETKGFEMWRDALFVRGSSTPSERPRYNALVVDVSTVAGNDLELTCLSLIQEFLALNNGSGESSDGDSNPCRVVIVKSGSLQTLARRLYHAQRLFAGTQSLPSAYNANEEASIIGTVGVEEYRRTIPYVVQTGDRCVEVGCHFGTSTTLIDRAAKMDTIDTDPHPGIRPTYTGGCLGVDIGPNIIKAAKVKFPHVSFEVGNGFKTGQLARMQRTYFANTNTNTTEARNDQSLNRIYDVVYVDIGGLSGSEGLLEAVALLTSIGNSLEPRVICIKSLCVRRLATNLIPFSEVWNRERLARQGNNTVELTRTPGNP